MKETPGKLFATTCISGFKTLCKYAFVGYVAKVTLDSFNRKELS